MFNLLDISGSSMTAHKLMLDTVSNNLANINTVAESKDTVYQRQGVIFETFGDFLNSKLGVKATAITNSEREAVAQYDPTHPYADEEGYIYTPDINLTEEMADMIVAQRGYSVNVQVLNYSREMIEKTLEIGR